MAFLLYWTGRDYGTKMKYMIKEKNINFEYIKLNVGEFKDFIDPQASVNQKSNMANIYKSFEIGRDGKYDLLYFLEDDYIHLSLIHI